MASLPEQPERLDLRSHDIAGDKLAQLLQLFPEARTEDGQIDFDQLRRALGDAVDPGKERYGLTWPGKAECFKTIQTPSLGTLLPAPEESVNWESTENLIIEGDNLEVLKLLQKSYLGKVKMIYIDPPYNTGNDFIYPDDYAESLKTYLEYTGQVDEEGRKFSTNTDTDGRFHSKWLNMMYPRLYLARNLLRDDGVIFISIDDNEIANLRKLADDIFGEENYVSDLAVVRAEGGGLAKQVVRGHDYLMIYARDKSRFEPLKRPKDIRGRIVQRDGVDYWIEEDWLRKEFGKYGTCPYDEIEKYHGPEKKAEIDRGLASGAYELITRRSGEVIVGRLRRVDQDASKFYSVVKHLNASGVDDLRRLGLAEAYSFPKPVSLVRELALGATFGSKSDDIVLDFFAGSGTTAEAVLSLNDEDDGNRRFILVQLPEWLDRDNNDQAAGAEFCESIGAPPTIAEITKERVRRVIAKLNDEKGEADGQDRGFRVFKLAESNFSIWDAQGSRQLGAFLEQLQLHVDNVRDDRTSEDVLFELLLKSGYPLSASIEPLDIAGKRVFSVADGAFLVCIDRGVTLELMREVAERRPERFVVLDEGFAGNDQLKANAVQIFKAADVTFRTV